MKCNCLNHFVRIGRANYRCVECLGDITMELVMMYEIGEKLEPTHKTWIFDSFEKNKQFKVGDTLGIGGNNYKVMKIDGTRVICAKLIPEHK